MSSARQKTLSRMRVLVAASTTAVASINCNDCNGYAVVDPLPSPSIAGGGGGFCGTIAATFKVGARTHAPTVKDASAPESGAPIIVDAGGNDGGDAGVMDAGIAPEAGAGPGTGTPASTRTMFFAIETRTATAPSTGLAPVSLKRAKFSVSGGKILNLRQSELLTEMDIEVDNGSSDFGTGLTEFTVAMVLDSSCGGGSGTTETVSFVVTFDRDGVVKIVGDSNSGGGEEPLENEL
jgi:hypothetical protein